MGGTIGIPRGDMWVVMGGPDGQLGALMGEPENGLDFRTLLGLWAPPTDPVRTHFLCKMVVEHPSTCQMVLQHRSTCKMVVKIR